MKRVTVILCFFTLISCQDKVICPAFQSTYILDDSTREAYFSYVWQLDENTRTHYLANKQTADSSTTDSLGVVTQPKTDYYAYAGEIVVPWRVPKRTKYGIVKPVFYPVKNYRLRTAPMENIFGPEVISNEFIAEDFSDSLAVDSLALASDSLVVNEPVADVEEEKDRFLYGYQPDDSFNVEQYYYNKYFGEKLIDNRPIPEPVVAPVDSLSADSLQAKEPFLKGLFKKKKKEEEPLEDLGEEPTEEETTPSETEEGTEGGGR